jgi:hypothetical protein
VVAIITAKDTLHDMRLQFNYRPGDILINREVMKGFEPDENQVRLKVVNTKLFPYRYMIISGRYPNSFSGQIREVPKDYLEKNYTKAEF